MAYNLIIQTEVILEIQEAFDWYHKARYGLGFELIKEIERCYSKIGENPQYYGFISKKFRSIRTKRFPYLIIVEIIEDKVFIYNFLHGKRKNKNR